MLKKPLLQDFHTSAVGETKLTPKISFNFSSIAWNILSKCTVSAFQPGTWIAWTPPTNFLNAGESTVDSCNISSTMYSDIKLDSFVVYIELLPMSCFLRCPSPITAVSS